MEKVVFKKGKIIQNTSERVTYPGNHVSYKQNLTILTGLFKKYTCTWDASDPDNLFGVGQRVGLWIVEGGEVNGVAKIQSLI